MSMSTHLIGFRPPDDVWQKMQAIYDACRVAGIVIPEEVREFFGGEAPDVRGIAVTLPVQEWADEYGCGYEIAVKDLPPQVTVLRFYNAHEERAVHG